MLVSSAPALSARGASRRVAQRGRIAAGRARVAPVKADATPAKESLKEQLERLRRENEELKAKLGQKAGAVTAAPPNQRAAAPASADAASGAATKAAADAIAAPAAPAPAAPAEPAVEWTSDLDLKVPDNIAWPKPGDKFWERPPATDRGVEPRNVRKDSRTFHVIHIGAEMAPVAKVGGLGDVVTGLARAGRARGHWTEVYLPFYELLNDKLKNVEHVMDFEFSVGRPWDGEVQWNPLKTSVFRSEVMGVPVFLFRPDNNWFKGAQIYGGPTTEAYLYFSRAALEFIKRKGDQPDILHIHDWHTAPVSMLYWEAYSKEIRKASVVLTVHNFAQPGECRLEEFSATGFPGDDYMTIERALDERTIGHNPERMCLLKGGLIYSNAVTTVSPTYAKEVRGGGGGFLSKHIVAVEDKFSGIVNGIDDDIWNPLTDPYLPANFSARNPQNKAVCKKFVQRGLGMRETEGQRVPLVVCISRLVPQKGVGLIEHAIRHTKAKGGQFVLLGTGGSDAPLRAMAAQLKDDPDVKFVFAFSDELSHHLFGAADMILVPSIFEPCGLTQLLGQRYGAVPVVRRTGGLADTVDPNPESGTGFVFDGQGAPDVQRALDEAVGAYADAARWDALVKRCMTKDNSWDLSFGVYSNIYAKAARA